MNATFHFIKANPTPGSLVFTIRGFHGAGYAADGMITPVMKRIVRNFVVADVIPDGFA